MCRLTTPRRKNVSRYTILHRASDLLAFMDIAVNLLVTEKARTSVSGRLLVSLERLELYCLTVRTVSLRRSYPDIRSVRV